MVTGKRRGRRTGTPDTAGDILRAARTALARDGYKAMSMRSVARDADVDPALVHYHFGTKAGLAAAALEMPFDPSAVLAQVFDTPPPAGSTRGRELLSAFLTSWDPPAHRAVLVGAIRSAASDDAIARAISNWLTGVVVERLTKAASGKQRRPRAIAIHGILIGTAFERYVLAVEPLASMTPRAAGKVIGPAIDTLLDAG